MKRAILALCLAAAASPAAAIDRNFGVSGFDRIRVDGNFKVTVTNGVAPFAKARGSMRAVDRVSVRVEGRTLIVRSTTTADWGGYPGESAGAVEVLVGTHELSTVWINGAGAVAIDQVKALKFDATAEGAGLLSIDRLDVDQFKMGMAGSATARIGGKAGTADILIRGSSQFDGEQLLAKDATIATQGPAVVKLGVTGSAKVDATGVSTVDLAGSPACTVKTQGSASVTGCKGSAR